MRRKKKVTRLGNSKFHPWSDCAICTHFDWDTCTCPAYPKKVPVELYGNWFKHREIREDQEGEWVFEVSQRAIDKEFRTDRPTKDTPPPSKKEE